VQAREAREERVRAEAAGRPVPSRFVHHRVDTLDDLRAQAQLAVEIELTTIPVYLAALYSIQDRSSVPYQILRSVVVEEMLHVNQAANLLVAIGGKPKLTGDAAPRYPTYLPSASKGGTPYVGIYRASLAVFENVFMAIEMPAPFTAPAEGKDYSTIGQFYKALEDALDQCVKRFGPEAVFRPAGDARQRTDMYVGKFGGRTIEVRDLATAHEAIQQIVQQGEGAVDPTHTLVPTETFGAYNHYGQRIDGTYGPILGTPYELSHYFKFKRVVEAGAFPDTFPCVSNPRARDFPNPEAQRTAVAFNKAYGLTLHTLEMSFDRGAHADGIYFETALPLMHGVLPKLAATLVNTTVLAEGDASVGPNAAPTFEYDGESGFGETIAAVEALASPRPSPGFRASRPILVAATAPSARAEERWPAGAEVAGSVARELETLARVAQAAGRKL
jgi:hypothetical protein